MLEAFFRNLISDSRHKNPDDVNVLSHGHGDGGKYFVKWEDVENGEVLVFEVKMDYVGTAIDTSAGNFDVVF